MLPCCYELKTYAACKLAKLYLIEGENRSTERAIEVLEGVPDNPFASVMLGKIYSDPEYKEQYNVGKAIEAYERAYASDDSFKEAVAYRLAKLYLTVIRGTPVVVQLMIAYFIIFASSNNKIMIAVIAFGFNSGAYVAEIVRSGIMSIDNGQFEAGRSLGFNYVQTMMYIIIPQAFKNVLPALANEFIVLIKETSVSGYVGLMDMTKGGDIIRSRTYSAFMPLIAVALIYLLIVMFFSKLVSNLERRLRSSERR